MLPGRDPAFRQQLMAESLELLISELSKLRGETAADESTLTGEARPVDKA